MSVARKLNTKILETAEKLERHNSPTKSRIMELKNVSELPIDPDLSPIPQAQWPELLNKHFPFFKSLPETDHKAFLDAVDYVHSTKNFVFQIGFTGDKNLAKLLVSASAARFILKRANELLAKFNTFVLYPGNFVNGGDSAGALGMASYWDRKTTRNQLTYQFQKLSTLANVAEDTLLGIYEELSGSKRTPEQNRRIAALRVAAKALQVPFPAPNASDKQMLAAIPRYQEFQKAMLAAFEEGRNAFNRKLTMEMRSMIASYKQLPVDEVTFEDFQTFYADLIANSHTSLAHLEHAIAVLESPVKITSIVHLPYSMFQQSMTMPGSTPDICAHELGHCIDLLDGKMDGLAPDSADIRPDWPARWKQYLDKEAAAFTENFMGVSDPDIQKAEFFAEACAAYFRCPEKMKETAPVAFDLMKEYFGYEPPQLSNSWWTFLKTAIATH